MKHSDAEFQPRFAYGDQAQAAMLCGTDDGSKLGAGLVRMENACIPWQVKYDEIILVLEGTFSVRIGDDLLTAHALDTMWLPAGTDLIYEAEKALLFFAIHPADWAMAEAE
ncbi:MAG: ethanolamine utilization protein EutQ [Pikeienuella sp.]